LIFYLARTTALNNHTLSSIIALIITKSEKLAKMNMMVPHSHNSFHHCCQILLALLLFSLQMLAHIEASGLKVEVLPGFQEPLPFELETGSTILIFPVEQG
jgi:hypothetical protein